MGELAPHSRRPLAYDWDHRFEDEEPGPEGAGLKLVVIDDDGQPQPMEDRELDRRGLGHIVTTAAAIPSQRKPPSEETIPRQHPESSESAHEPHEVVPDTSIYLG